MRTLCLSLLLALGMLCPAQAAPVAGIAAVVNGDIITVRQLDRAVEPEIAARGLNPENSGDAAQIEALRSQTLEGMINEKILMQEADRLGISISDERVEAELDRFVADSQLSREEFMRQLSRQGLTMDKMRERLRGTLVAQQLIGRMVVSKVVVTEEEINEYYRQHMGDLPSGQVRFGLLIYPAGEDAEAWAGLIASGRESFEDVARKVSVGPNAQEGGDMGFMNVEDLAPALRREVESLKKGQVSGVFDMQVNKAQVRLTDVVSEGEAPLPAGPDAAVAARIEEILKGPRLDARFREYTEQMRNRALVDIRRQRPGS